MPDRIQHQVPVISAAKDQNMIPSQLIAFALVATPMAKAIIAKSNVAISEGGSKVVLRTTRSSWSSSYNSARSFKGWAPLS